MGFLSYFSLRLADADKIRFQGTADSRKVGQPERMNTDKNGLCGAHQLVFAWREKQAWFPKMNPWDKFRSLSGIRHK